MQSQKRPLEDPSADSGPGDQPEAKRPALDNVVKEENGQDASASLPSQALAGADAGDVNAEPESVNANGAASADPGAAATAIPSAAAVLETQPIQSTSSTNGHSSSQGAFTNQHQDETGWLHVRAIISSAEAATVIGKGGENVTLIRRLSGAKCTVSDYSRGAVERVLTVSGLVDAVAKVWVSMPVISHAVALIPTGFWLDYPYIEQRTA